MTIQPRGTVTKCVPFHVDAEVSLLWTSTREAGRPVLIATVQVEAAPNELEGSATPSSLYKKMACSLNTLTDTEEPRGWQKGQGKERGLPTLEMIFLSWRNVFSLVCDKQ